METLNDLITTKQQEAKKLFSKNLFSGSWKTTDNEIDAFVLSTAQSVLDAVKELVPEEENERTYLPEMAMGWNGCRDELLSRLERFSSNDT